jgi:hypothetical protein
MEEITEIGTETEIHRVVNSFGGNKCLPEIMEMAVVETGTEDREMVEEIGNLKDATETSIRTINQKHNKKSISFLFVRLSTTNYKNEF